MAQKDTSAPYSLLGKKLACFVRRTVKALLKWRSGNRRKFLTNIEAGKDRLTGASCCYSSAT
ncbi:hypothetical protein IPL68_01510 [Candidatus Saccharibacteria bacterium]|nr:MAG: hypothetical protein IPL68_01510 [Candidatus Saccharibacteria bacterium]